MMTIEEAIIAMQSLSPRLNAASDEASILIRRTEVFLSDELHLGIEHFCDPTRNGYCLCYARIGPRYRVAVRDYSEGLIRPWLESSRTAKLSTFPDLGSLCLALASKAHDLESAVQSALTMSKAVLVALENANARAD